MDYYAGLTPFEQSIKRNYDIKQLLKQQKIPVPKNMNPQTILALRDKQSLDEVQSRKLKAKQQLQYRPLSQGSLMHLSLSLPQFSLSQNSINQNHEYIQQQQLQQMQLQQLQYQQFLAQELQNSAEEQALNNQNNEMNEAQAIALHQVQNDQQMSNVLYQTQTAQMKNYQTLKHFTNQNLAPLYQTISPKNNQQNFFQGRLSKNKVSEVLQLRKGYALSQRAPSVQITRNSIFAEKFASLRAQMVQTNSSLENNNAILTTENSSLKIGNDLIGPWKEGLAGSHQVKIVKKGQVPLQSQHQRQITQQYENVNGSFKLNSHAQLKGIDTKFIPKDEGLGINKSARDSFPTSFYIASSTQTKKVGIRKTSSLHSLQLTPYESDAKFNPRIFEGNISGSGDPADPHRSLFQQKPIKVVTYDHQIIDSFQEIQPTQDEKQENLDGQSNDQYFNQEQIDVDDFIERANQRALQKQYSDIDMKFRIRGKEQDSLHKESLQGRVYIPRKPEKKLENTDGGSKKYLSSNDQLFMNIFQCTALPSPPNIPINESLKFKNYSERDRYYKIAGELMKIKKIIENDPVNLEYYSTTFLKKFSGLPVITEMQVQVFNQFLERYDLPPFVAGFGLKEFLQLVVFEELEQVVREQEDELKKNSKKQGSIFLQNKKVPTLNLVHTQSQQNFNIGLEEGTFPSQIESILPSPANRQQSSTNTLFFLNSDMRNLQKQQKRTESQKSLHEKIESYRKSIIGNFKKYNFQSTSSDLDKIQRLKIEIRQKQGGVIGGSFVSVDGVGGSLSHKSIKQRLGTSPMLQTSSTVNARDRLNNLQPQFDSQLSIGIVKLQNPQKTPEKESRLKEPEAFSEVIQNQQDQQRLEQEGTSTQEDFKKRMATANANHIGFGLNIQSQRNVQTAINNLSTPKSQRNANRIPMTTQNLIAGLQSSQSFKKVNQRKGLLLFSNEKPKQAIEGQTKIENLMMKRIEEREQAEEDIKVLNEEKYSSKWNSRKFFWKNNPQMKRSMSHLNFFSNQQKKDTQLKTII